MKFDKINRGARIGFATIVGSASAVGALALAAERFYDDHTADARMAFFTAVGFAITTMAGRYAQATVAAAKVPLLVDPDLEPVPHPANPAEVAALSKIGTLSTPMSSETAESSGADKSPPAVRGVQPDAPEGILPDTNAQGDA